MTGDIHIIETVAKHVERLAAAWRNIPATERWLFRIDYPALADEIGFLVEYLDDLAKERDGKR